MPSTHRSEATLARSLFHQVVGVGKGESVLRRDSPLRASDLQDNEYNSPERLRPRRPFVALPGHPLYSRQVTTFERPTSAA
jgi:hypothetical protein